MNINVLDLSLACLSIEKEAFTRSDSHDVRRQRKYSDTFLKPMLDSLTRMADGAASQRVP